MGSPVRYPFGISTCNKQDLLGDYPLPSPFSSSSTAGKNVISYSNDFLDLGAAASRTITGAGTAFALIDGLGGLGTLTPGGATVASSIYRTAAAFQFVAGNKFWFVHRLKASAVTGNQVVSFGMTKVSSGTVATTDRLMFVKAAGSTSLNLVSTVNNTATTLVTGVTTMADDTFVDIGFYYDGRDLFVFSDNTVVARVANVTIGTTGTTLTNAVMSPITAITPVATETVTLDYALIAQEITR